MSRSLALLPASLNDTLHFWHMFWLTVTAQCWCTPTHISQARAGHMISHSKTGIADSNPCM